MNILNLVQTDPLSPSPNSDSMEAEPATGEEGVVFLCPNYCFIPLPPNPGCWAKCWFWSLHHWNRGKEQPQRTDRWVMGQKKCFPLVLFVMYPHFSALSFCGQFCGCIGKVFGAGDLPMVPLMRKPLSMPVSFGLFVVLELWPLFMEVPSISVCLY